MAKSYELCGMYFKTSSIYNCQTYEETVYYRLVESYRDAAGQPRQRTILSLGKDVDNSLPFGEIANKLNGMLTGSRSLFPLEEKAEKFTHYVFNRLVKEKKIDLVRKIQSEAKEWERVDLSTLTNEDVRELGAGWMSLQALQELGVDKFLRLRGWEEENVQLALTHNDLTDTYFEGRMANSKIAKFGRSKEKRSDCKLLVLALVVNVEGFIKYSSIFEGNMADCKTSERKQALFD